MKIGRTHSMAFMANQRQQLCLEDSTYSLTERSQKMLKKSWAENFAQHIFPLINEDRFSVLYSTNQASLPNTPVNVNIGLLLLKEMFGSTDEELMETVLFDVRYQYALHTTSFAEQPVSDRTLSRFRERLYIYEPGDRHRSNESRNGISCQGLCETSGDQPANETNG